MDLNGQIVTTFATADLCDIMLRDSAHIQEFEAEWRNRKARRSGEPLYEPLYTMQDAQDAVELLAPCDYEQRIELCKGVEVRFTDIGHLLGSACIEIWITEEGLSRKIVIFRRRRKYQSADYQRPETDKRGRLCCD